MIDPTLQPTDPWQRRVLERALALNVTIRRVRPHADVVECRGPAGRVVAAELRLISYGDVERAAGVRHE